MSVNSISSTLLSSPTAQRPGVVHPAHTQQGGVDLSTNQAGTVTTQAIPIVRAGIPDHMPMTSVPCAQAGSGGVRVQAQVSHDAVVPKMDVMRSIPSVSSAVSRLLAQYDDQADHEALPGKISNARKRSGRYNTTDTSIVSPQYRWPNEGLVSNSHIKKPSYDELNMGQWASGQLNNMLLVEDNTTLRCMLTQMSMAMRDASSLPWSAVPSAWAVSMTDIEEGRLQWSDSLQWSLFYLFIYLGFYVAFNTVQVISGRVVGRAEETSTYSSLGFCTVNCRPTASNYQLSHLRP